MRHYRLEPFFFNGDFWQALPMRTVCDEQEAEKEKKVYEDALGMKCYITVIEPEQRMFP